MIEIFTKEQFEAVLGNLDYDVTPLGLVQGNYAYSLDFGNPLATITVYSSVAPSGSSRDCGEDSIRAWLVAKDGTPIGGKVQKYVKRTKSWRQNLAHMLANVANLGKHIKPCPTCNAPLALAVRDDKVYIFCPVDSKERKNPNHQRHVPLLCLDKKSGEELEPPKPAAPQAQPCPVCGTAMIKVNIRHGSNAGKQALTCPKKENGKYLNHHFEVLS